MKIEPRQITVRALTDGYTDDSEGGVRGYGRKLDIRPPFQREFVYKDKQRDEVIRTITKGFPLNVMYWAVHDDGTYEIIDGQLRTISLGEPRRSGFRESVKLRSSAALSSQAGWAYWRGRRRSRPQVAVQIGHRGPV